MSMRYRISAGRREMRNADEIAAVNSSAFTWDRQTRKSTAFVDTIRRTAAKPLAFPEPAEA
jgi:hypothetical protein